jgi:plasmid stabilization system protein ParE
MAALRVIIARQAANDLDEIWDYVAKDASPNIASDVIEEILDAIELLVEMPGMGTHAPIFPNGSECGACFAF